MKKHILMAILAGCVMVTAGCSNSQKKETEAPKPVETAAARESEASETKTTAAETETAAVETEAAAAQTEAAAVETEAAAAETEVVVAAAGATTEAAETEAAAAETEATAAETEAAPAETEAAAEETEEAAGETEEAIAETEAAEETEAAAGETEEAIAETEAEEETEAAAGETEEAFAETEEDTEAAAGETEEAILETEAEEETEEAVEETEEAFAETEAEEDTEAAEETEAETLLETESEFSIASLILGNETESDLYDAAQTEEDLFGYTETESDLYDAAETEEDLYDYTETETELPPAPTYNAADYLVIDDDGYKELTVQVPAAKQTTDVEVNDQIEQEFQYVENYDDYVKKITSGKVKYGDVVNIDYEGTKDGKPFDGGTAENYNLEIGSDSFIFGFEDGLIGKEIGSECDLDLTFPEEYPVEDLAGEDVVFHVTINYVGEMPELTDELAGKLSYGEYDNVEDYVQSVRDEIQAGYDEEHKNEAYTAIMTSLADMYPVEEYPEENVDYQVDMMMKQFEAFAPMYGMDVDSLIESFYGMKVDEFIENELTPSAENALAQEIILTAISEKEGITMDDEELDERLAERAEAEGVSVETFTGGLDRETVRSYLLQDKVMDWLYQNVRIEEIEETENYYTFGNETEAETESVFGNETEAETESVSVNETEAETESVSVNETEAETESVSANETEAETESDMADETEKA